LSQSQNPDSLFTFKSRAGETETFFSFFIIFFCQIKRQIGWI
jgi:hypothetical protein